MKKWKWMLCLLVAMCLLVPFGTGAVAQETYAPADEFERALWYGFLPEELSGADYESAITWAQYTRMISRMIEVYAPNKLVEWQELSALTLEHHDAMERSQGSFVLTQAAKLLDLYSVVPTMTNCNRHLLREFIGPPSSEAGFYQFGGHEGSWMFENKFDPVIDMGTVNAVQAALFFCQLRTSCCSFTPLFTSDKRSDAPLTVRDALLSVVRLYESDAKVAQDMWLQRIDALTAEVAALGEPEEVTLRREAILNSPTTIVHSDTLIPGETYTGQAYYVSNSGDDNNDGQSPEKAWATLAKVARTPLQNGDAVFFERGGIYRGNLYLYGMDGCVTVSAYGEGAKPVITSALENASGSEKWELYAEGENGEKIWKFYREVMDCSVIVLDDAAAATKKWAVWSGSGWVNEDGSPYDVAKGLSEDLRFFNDDSAKFQGNVDFSVHQVTRDVDKTGALYLRCDQGNPGEVYASIELCTLSATEQRNGGYEQTTLNNLNEQVLDNLSIKYYCMFGTNPCAVVQNCEFAWGGGGYSILENGRLPQGNLAGDAIVANWASDTTIRNNYFHDVFTAPLTLESYSGEDFGSEKNVHFLGNLIERGDLGFNIDYEEQGGREGHFVGTIEGLRIADNIFYCSGLGWPTRYSLEESLWGGLSTQYCIRIRQREYLVDCSITDNRFYYPLSFVLYFGTDPANTPAMSGNQYYLAEFSGDAAFWRDGERFEAFRTISDQEIESFLRDYCSDETSVIHQVGTK